MLTIVSIFALIASACAGGQEQHLLPPSPGLAYGGYGVPSVLSAGVYGPSVLSSGVVGPSVLSSGVYGPSVLSAGVYGPSALSAGVYGPSVLSAGVVGRSVLAAPAVAAGPAVLSAPVAVARPAAVAVEQVSYGSVPSVSVVNEPTSIVAPGRPIRGHSFTSEVRHDSAVRVAALAAPVALAAPAPLAVAAPAPLAVAAPAWSAYSVGAPSVIASAPRLLATGPASVVAAPASVKGYSLETGRTDVVNQVVHRAASIPAQIIQDTVVESAPVVSNVFSAPVYSSVVGGPAVVPGLLGGHGLLSAWKK